MEEAGWLGWGWGREGAPLGDPSSATCPLCLTWKYRNVSGNRREEGRRNANAYCISGDSFAAIDTHVTALGLLFRAIQMLDGWTGRCFGAACLENRQLAELPPPFACSCCFACFRKKMLVFNYANRVIPLFASTCVFFSLKSGLLLRALLLSGCIIQKLLFFFAIKPSINAMFRLMQSLRQINTSMFDRCAFFRTQTALTPSATRATPAASELLSGARRWLLTTP